MGFSEIFIRRPVLSTVLASLILFLGLAAVVNLPVRQYPEVEETVITVTTTYPGAAPDLIQGFITVPIQQAVASAEGIDTLTASSSQNVSTVTLNLKLDAVDRGTAGDLARDLAASITMERSRSIGMGL